MQCKDTGADERKKKDQALLQWPPRPSVKSLNLHSVCGPQGASASMRDPTSSPEL